MLDDFYFGLLSNVWNSPVKDMKPMKAFAVEDGYNIVCKTLGIAKEDIHVDVINDGGSPMLKISGATRIDNIDFENTVDLRIKLTYAEKIEAIEYCVRDGLTIIHLKIDRTIPTNLTATYSDNLLTN